MRRGWRVRSLLGAPVSLLAALVLVGSLAAPAYAAKRPQAVIDSGPASVTSSTTATFQFHSTVNPATFTCKLDSGAAAACTSPKTYTALAQGTHTFAVTATSGGITSPSPATATWTVDVTPPSVPAGVAATPQSDTSIAVSWTASTDNVAVAGYDVFRDGALLVSLGAVTTYTDSGLVTGSSHQYAVRARDTAGNLSQLSAPVTASTLSPPVVQLTRAPYLTDLSGLHATVNFGTDQSASTATVRFGPVQSGICSLTSTVSAVLRGIIVNSLPEWQWKAGLSLPAAGTYCYRVYLAGSDLLGANPSPQFTTQVQLGSTESYTFDVFGDWGQVDATGANADQANLMQQIAHSGARFAVSVGDNGYPAGSQGNYGDLQQTGADTSAVFGPQFWPVAGSSLALFPASGNHGINAATQTASTEQVNWPQDVTVATSGGRYVRETYCCVNGTTSASYPSSWYAFDVGTARFYVLQADWADSNPGTGTVYSDDYAAHWAPGTPEYQWLAADLAAHPSGLKFAFFHYPLYSDQKAQNSDTFLQGNSSLEGLLAGHGVDIAFNGHAHMYERNAAASGKGRLGLVSYVTGGGGATLQPVGEVGCSAIDLYAIGWSPTNSVGSKCGAAIAPTSQTQVFHFLKVTVNGSKVTVTPTDELGRTFDVQTYMFKPLPDTYIDSSPPAGTTSTSASFQFHASTSGATFTCKLDSGTATACTSPVSYSNLAQGSHTFSVFATVSGVKDPLPATWTWTVDFTPPSSPTGLSASATSPFSVQLQWTAATDNTGVTAYDVYRDGSLLTSVPGTATSFTDTAVLGNSTHSYAVRARDVAGNVSGLTAPVPATTPPPPVPVFADGFESGTLSAWTSSAGLSVEGTTVHGGSFAAEGNTVNGGTFAKKTLGSTYTDGYARVWFDAVSQTDQINLLRMRDAAGNSIGYVYLGVGGALAFHDDATGVNTVSATQPGPGWHALELHLGVNGAASTVEVWLDNALVADLGTVAGTDLGTAPVGQLQIGEVQTGRTYDVAFDDAAFGTARLGPVADSTPPSVPGSFGASASSPFSVALTWSASTDDVGVVAYDVFRDGSLLTSVDGSATSFSDTGVLAGSSHVYAVQARDLAGNTSALTAAVPVTLPAAPVPVFADGFESGTLSAWTSAGGLTVEGSDVRTGSFAAEGNTVNGGTFAKKTLGATYADAYARVGFELKSQASQVNLLRMRDAAGNSIGFLFVSAGGHLGFHDDATGVNTSSATVPGPGWHALELHLGLNGTAGTVEVWLDGTPVADLSTVGGVDLGIAPVGQLQVGDVQTGTTYDVVLDDAAFGTARLGPVADGTPPSVPGSFTASATSPFSVALSWSASTDDVAVVAYDVYRDGALLASVGGSTTAFTDTAVVGGASHSYAVQARDPSGNVSGLTAAVPVTTPAAPVPVFADGFESGTLSAWTSSAGLAIEGTDVRTGSFAAEGNTVNGGTFAKKTLGSTFADAFARVGFELKSQTSQVNLLRMRDAAGNSIGYVFVSAGGHLGFHDDATGVNTSSVTVPGPGWHALELHLGVNGTASTVEVWLDNALVADLSAAGTANLGVAPVGQLQVGDAQTGTTYDVVLDDAAFGTSRLGPVADGTPPSVPGGVGAVASSPFSVDVSWSASTDDVGVASYDVFRDGSLLTTVGAATTAFTDTTVLAGSTHSYAVQARDVSGNVSGLSAPVPVTLPAAATPLFADGFESGDLSAWTSSGGLTVEGTDVRTGSFAAEGNTVNGATFAKKTLGSTFADAYARLGFELKSQSSQVNLLRMRDSVGNSIGYVYIATNGALGFHDDATGLNTASATVPGAGWHALELHLGVNGTASTVEVWLDGVRVSDLSVAGTANLGVAPVGQLQIGETQTARTYDVVLDDAAFGSSRVGP